MKRRRVAARVRVLGVVFVLGLFGTGPRGAWAWGPAAQQAVVARAIETLPKGLKPFYKNHKLEMPSLALEPSFPEDSPERHFAIDRLMPWPFADVPRTEKEMKARYGEPGTAIGRLRCLVQDSYAQLVAAF